jgi:hypothetical protein
MRTDRKADVTFSSSAKDYILRFMEAVERTAPHTSLIPIIMWYVDRTFTDKETGKVTKYGPGVGVGAIEPEKLTDELIVPMGGLKVAIRLPDELQSAGRLKLDFVDGSFVVVGK